MPDALARIYVRESIDEAGQPVVVVGKLRRGSVREGVRANVCRDILGVDTRVTRVQQRPAAPEDDDVTISFEVLDGDHRFLLVELCRHGTTIGVVEITDEG